MLDRPNPPPKPNIETAFRKWWDAQGPSFGTRVDLVVAKKLFRAGYSSGRRANINRYIFAAGLFRITVWTEGLQAAKRKAIIEANDRAAKRGWKPPKTGWVPKEVS